MHASEAIRPLSVEPDDTCPAAASPGGSQHIPAPHWPPRASRDALATAIGAMIRRLNFDAAACFVAAPTDSTLRLQHVSGFEWDAIPQPVRCRNSAAAERQAIAEGFALIRNGSGIRREELPQGVKTALVLALFDRDRTLRGVVWLYATTARTLPARVLLAAFEAAREVGRSLGEHPAVVVPERWSRVERELEVAARQWSHVVVPELPAAWNLDVAVRSEAATEIGGDICELSVPRPERLWLAIGDAVGHGIPAALLSAAARGAYRAQFSADRSPSPAGVIGALGPSLYRLTEGERFLTLLVAELDVRRWQLRYCNAGHTWPLVLRRGRSVPVQSHGLPLGILPDSDYRSTTIPLQPSDRLVLLTDGITEASDERKALYGREAIQRLASANATSAAICDAIWSDVQAFATNTAADDRTLCVVQRHEATAARGSISSC